eukprot:gene43596-44149_t
MGPSKGTSHTPNPPSILKKEERELRDAEAEQQRRERAAATRARRVDSLSKQLEEARDANVAAEVELQKAQQAVAMAKRQLAVREEAQA